MQLKENIIKGCIQQLQGVLQSIHVASRRKLVNRCIAYEDPEHDRTVIERHVANGGSQLRLNVSNKKTDVESQPFEAENRRINL